MADSIRKRRQPVRAAFTRALNELKTLLEADPQEERSIQVKFLKVSQLFEKLKESDGLLLDKLVEDDVDVAEYTQEFEAIEVYHDSWREICTDMERFRQPPVRLPGSPAASEFGTAASGISSPSKKTYKLPKIELQKFNGDIKNWVGWWSQFKKIHDDEDLHDTDKFHYLKQSMTPGSAARNVVERFPQSEENYSKAIKALKERFGNKKVLIHCHIRELIRLIIKNTGSKVKLADIYDDLETQLEALESMGIPSDQISLFLFPLVESCIPSETLTAWYRGPGASFEETNDVNEEFKMFRNFLRSERTSEQRRRYAQENYGSSTEKKESRQSFDKKKSKSDVPTAAGLFSGQGSGCIFCEKNHLSQECMKARGMTKEEKQEKIKSKRACFSCLKKGHSSKDCKSFVRCFMCGGRHQTIMCRQQDYQKEEKTCEGQTVVNLNCTSSILLNTIRVRAIGKKNNLVVRLVLDEGSQRSYIRKETAKKLNLKSIGEEYMQKSLFSGKISAVKKHHRYELTLESLDGRTRFTLNVLDEPVICGKISNVKKGTWIEELIQKQIKINDFDSKDEEIDVLIGSDYRGKVNLFEGFNLECGLTATNTIFGWTLSGPVPNDSISMTVTSALIVNQVSVSELWSLETIGIRDPIESSSQEEKNLAVLNHFAKTVKVKEGRYSVSLPWSDEQQRIPTNRNVAERRLISATTKLKSADKIKEYDGIFKEWEKEGIVKTVTLDEDEYSHFLPHRPVFKPESLTTPIRPVFDASCKTGRNPSLNECLEKGPNLLDLIPSLLLRFREKKIGVISDIRKAFQMIEIDPVDRKFQRFLWWEDETCKKIKIFEHQRVVFGINCSPFLLQAVLSYHLRQYSPPEEDIAKKLLNSLYVDNCVTSVNTILDYEEFKTKCSSFLKEAGMDLRKWERTEDDPRVGLSGCGLGSGSSQTSVLGLRWDKQEDSLSLDLNLKKDETKITKRRILSEVQRIFDPIGFSSPATLKPKIILQKLWATNLGWDEEVPEDIRREYQWWGEGLSSLRRIWIARNIITSQEEEKLQIHVFVDASQEAYAAAVFIRNLGEDEVTINLAQAKSRVSPIKKSTIPRLELMACLIGARLTKSTKDALGLHHIKTTFWSDSMTALSWIRRNDNWGTFVGNRVKEILTVSDSSQWRHVPGVMNPADLPSRGCSPQELLDSRWWEGPTWLKSDPSEWPVTGEEPDEDEVTAEMKKSTMVNVNLKEDPWYVSKSNSYLRNVRILGWMRRFINNTKKSSVDRVIGKFLLQSEVKSGESDLIKIIQRDGFKNKLNQVGEVPVFQDEDGILHIKTKLTNKSDSQLFKTPILLPKNHPYVHNLIEEMHRIYSHTGVQTLMGRLREKFWIIQGRRLIKSIIRRCVRCRRHQSKNYEVEAAALPEKRVQATHSFQTTGVDLAGPMVLKNGGKIWIVIYTCAVYRCVALDLVSSLSTGIFLNSLERFISSYGRPDTVYSDHGTNFVGTVNLFKLLDKNIFHQSDLKKIRWILNPPTASWWGGWWERLIRSIKGLLKRMLGNAHLDEDELRTCLAAVSSEINHRPLTTLTEDPNDLIPLTPAMFLRGPIVSRFPEKNEVDCRRLQKDYKRTAILRKNLVGRFRKEYLSQLVQRSKEQTTATPKVGDVVLVGADGMKRIDWPMAKILEVIPGRDGLIRVARVKTSTGVLTRPLQRLYPMEISSLSDAEIPVAVADNVETETGSRNVEEVRESAEAEIGPRECTEENPIQEVKRSKYGRVLKKTVRFNI